MAHSEHPEDDRGPWTQPGFLAAAGVIALLAILGVVVALGGGGGRDDKSTSPGPSQAPTPPAEPARAGEAGECQVPPGSQRVPTSAPEDTQWELIGRMAAPTAPERYGPARTVDGVGACFARSPTGALYAAINILATTTVPDKREAAAQQLLAPGIGRDRFLAEIRRENVPATDESSPQIAGFSFGAYDRSSALINLVFAVTTPSDTGYVELPVAMRWDGDDWKLSVPDTGAPFAAIKPVPDLRERVRWSGA